MPNLKYSEHFWWLIQKQSNELTIGVSYENPPIWMELLRSEEEHPITWINTHFHVSPLEIPKNIMEFHSPEANSNIPKG